MSEYITNMIIQGTKNVTTAVTVIIFLNLVKSLLRRVFLDAEWGMVTKVAPAIAKTEMAKMIFSDIEVVIRDLY